MSARSGMPVGAINKHATGKGNASQDEMLAAMRAIGHVPGDDNEADALALLAWAMAQPGMAANVNDMSMSRQCRPGGTNGR